MSLQPGDTLGPYEILGAIGAGGMGEVYRAKDTRLKRDVALKVLPDALANDADRMARFQREAEVLASLNHPNIAHIYGVEERALVMELVEGETLEEKLRKSEVSSLKSDGSGLAVDEALVIARQIADALEEHAQIDVAAGVHPAGETRNSSSLETRRCPRRRR